MIPFPGVLAVRPVPSPESIRRSRQLMGENEHGVWTATKFVPPISPTDDRDLTPNEVFKPRMINTSVPGRVMERFCIRRRLVPQTAGLKTTCIYTDGACFDNGSQAAAPRGGAAFVFKNGSDGQVGFALEKEGVDGQPYAHTNSRAELRAVLAALTYRVWWGEGWQRIVVVTDSEYVSSHASGWLRNWASRGWRVSSGRPVANKDLWEELSRVMGTFAEAGCEISFWTVPRKLNSVADRAAKAAAERGGGGAEYSAQQGIMV